jgi:hypothetical protein
MVKLEKLLIFRNFWFFRFAIIKWSSVENRSVIHHNYKSEIKDLKMAAKDDSKD